MSGMAEPGPGAEATAEARNAEDRKSAAAQEAGAGGDEAEDRPGDDEAIASRFPPDQEASLLAEANAHKARANELFKNDETDGALAAYETAVAVLPSYLHFDRAVLQSNMAACYVKQSAWKEAVRSATDALEALDKEAERIKREQARPKEEADGRDDDDDDDEVELEIVSEGAARAARLPPPPKAPSTPAGPSEKDLLRIRAKSLLRRGRARSELGGWANLAGAEEDYKALSGLPKGTLGGADVQLVNKQLRQLPARTSKAKEEEMSDMMGKLKELGNGLLRPFGISTDNFQMVKDDKTGGYSMSFRPS